MRLSAIKLVLIGTLACSACVDKKPVSRPTDDSSISSPITEISLERTVCLGDCPSYKVTLRSDGTVTYVGEAFVAKKGTHQGKLDRYYFDKLSTLVESQGYFKMKNKYPDDETVTVDAPNAIIKVTRGEKQKSIFDNAIQGPPELWGIEMAIDAVVEKVTWEKAK